MKIKEPVKLPAIETIVRLIKEHGHSLTSLSNCYGVSINKLKEYMLENGVQPPTKYKTALRVNTRR